MSASAGPLPRVLVTRPQPQAGQWVASLQRLGVAATALPLLAIDAPADPQAVRDAWGRLGDTALVMFVSPSAVQRFFALSPEGRRWPDAVLAGSTGPGTRAALEHAGVPAHCVVSPEEAAGRFDSEALWALLRERRDWAGARALVVRGEGGRDWLADALRAAGARLDFVEAYRRSAVRPDPAFRAALAAAVAEPRAHCWLFSSSEAVGHLAALAPDVAWSAASALATHDRIAEAARRIGFAQVRRVWPSPEAVAQALAG